MERFLGDWAIEQGLALERLENVPVEIWIGVVGAGPSGLSFAYQMARRGYRVTIYESRAQAGGMLRYGVPDYRLPQEVLDAEIQRILDLGVDLKLNMAVGRDISLEALRARHTRLYLGIGAQMGREIGIPGETGPSVWTGTDFLSRINCGEEIEVGERVVVVGGGNTAIDAARVARRKGADVTVLYRRSLEEMPAREFEIEEALEEGINLFFLAAPVRIERTPDKKLDSLIACRTENSRPDIKPDQVKLDSKPASEAVRAPKLPGDERIARGSAEVSSTISEEQFLAEAERCFSCGFCFGCEQCSMFCTSGCFTRLEEAMPGMYFTLLLDECKECGKCIEVCPCGFLEATPQV